LAGAYPTPLRERIGGFFFGDAWCKLPIGPVVTEEAAVEQYAIYAQAAVGGSITPAGSTSCLRGENLLYRITASPGYTIDRVYVDGEDQGPVTSWYFEDVQDSHTIEATFKQDISALTVKLEENTFVYDGIAKTPVVTVTAADGTELVEDEDYLLCYNNNLEPGSGSVVVMARADSAYCGAMELPFTITGSADGVVESVTLSGRTLNAALTEKAYEKPAMLVAALYDTASNRLLMTKTKNLGTYGEVLTMTLDIQPPKNAYLKIYLIADNTLEPVAEPYFLPLNG